MLDFAQITVLFFQFGYTHFFTLLVKKKLKRIIILLETRTNLCTV